MEEVPAPRSIGQGVLKDLNSLTNKDVVDMRKILDYVPWSLFGEQLAPNDGSLLRINYFNLSLIEGFNAFGIEGLASVFRNRELVVPGVVVVKIIEHHLDFPRRDELGDAKTLLLPRDARPPAKVDYSGSLTVRIAVTDLKSGATTEVNEWIPFGKIPIMVGSKYCNLTNSALIKTKDDLNDAGEHCDDFMGYFIIAGNERVLISQNYSDANHVMVNSSKMKTSQQVKTVSVIRSKSPGGMTAMQKVFIMNSASAKLEHGDRRIYTLIGDIFKKNAYDASDTIVGINVISLFRMASILINYLNPILPQKSYLFAPEPADPSVGYPGRLAGLNGLSTFNIAKGYFESFVREYAGERLWASASSFINDTVNEASLESDELRFWEMTTTTSMVSAGKSVAEIAETMLLTFGQNFFPHIGTSFPILLRELSNLRLSIFRHVESMHQQSPSMMARENSVEEVNISLYHLASLMDMRRSGDPNTDTERARIRQERSIDLTAEYDAAYKVFLELRETMLTKMKLLAYMCVRVLRVEMGADTLDDRDSLANQMYENPGILMTSRFSALLRQVETHPKFQKITSSNPDNIKSILVDLGRSVITDEYASNFSNGEWNKRGVDNKRTGVTDIMPSSSSTARLAFLRRLSARSASHSANTASRELTGLQPGLVCPSETPEGTQCGNVEHLASAAFITNESFDTQTLAYKLVKLRTSRRRDSEAVINNINRPDSLKVELESFRSLATPAPSGGAMISASRNPQRETPLFLNGTPMGWVDGLSFRRQLITWRREGLIHPHTGVHYIQKVSKSGVIRSLSIKTTGGRIVQPLYIAEDPQKTLDLFWKIYLDFRAGRETTVLDLIEGGHIEFVDAGELEFLDLAPSPSTYLKSLLDGRPDRYDHIMLHPSFIMGISASIMPFANMNPVVRNSYFTQMVKQAIDLPLPTFAERAHTGVSKLLTPQVPIVKTDMYDQIFRKDYFGMNVRILIAPHKNGEEDGIIVRRGFIDRGGLSSIKYSAFPVFLKPTEELDFGQDFMDTTTDPDRYGRGIIRVRREVVHTREDGTTYVSHEPVVVGPNEILARKIEIKETPQTFVDIKHESLRDGIVDRIISGKSVSGHTNLYIIMRMPDELWHGDKIASRYSQKGVIAYVEDDADMPYNAETGEIADIIINPQAFPSRMTIGMLAEVLVANAHIFPDKNKNVFTLYRNRGLDVYAPLERLFLVPEPLWKEYKFDDGHVRHVFSPPPDGLPDLDAVRQPGSMLPPLVEEGGIKLPTPEQAVPMVLISSEDVASQEDLEFLKTHDKIKDLETFQTGLWAIKLHANSMPIAAKLGPENNGDRSFYMIVLGSTVGEDVRQSPKEDARLAPIYGLYPRLQAMTSFVLNTPASAVEVIPGLFMDTEVNEDGEKVNPMRGIRVSKFEPDVQEIYVRGNTYTPVATQMIAGYLESFFSRANLTGMFYDFTIPENMRSVGEVTFPGEQRSSERQLPPGIRFSALKKEKSMVKVITTVDTIRDGRVQYQADGVTPIQSVQEVERTILEIWTNRYSSFTIIPRENVIDLPAQASEIYAQRRERIESMRQATMFKEGMDLNDAIRELELMGYNPDMTTEHISGKTGKLINGGYVTGWSYYMPLKHKVKNKMQARGHGKHDMRLKQPNQGRVNGGGLRFNFADAQASIKSGAANFVSDRLLDASGKQDIFVCTTCKEVCYRHGAKSPTPGAIVCPLCTTKSETVKISVPYVFLLQRNLMMGAGVRMRVEAELDEPKSRGTGGLKDRDF